MGGKTQLQMRADLRSDLKDSATTWSNDELNRCIEKAVSDLSRYLPNEKTYEESLQFTVTDEEVKMPADTSADAVVKEEVLNLCGDGSTCSIAGQPDVSRPLVVTITDDNNSLIGLTIDIYGADENGEAIHETFFFTRMGSKVITGKKYFRYVYMVYTTQVEGAGPGDLLDVGYGTYTDVWVSLANKPIKWGSETGVTVDTDALTRNTAFYIDYIAGRIKAIKDGGIAASDTVTISYTKSQLGIDLSSLADLIRVERVEYPVGDIPQNFVQTDVWGKQLYVTGGGESYEQQSMAEDKHIRVYYSAEHQPPTEYSPGTIPEFLENTIIMAAGAYALLVEALQHEHQAATDLTSMRTALGNATGTHSALALILADVEKYLDNNTDESGEDAAAWLKKITTDIAPLRAAIGDAVIAMNIYLDDVGKADTGDLAKADLARANYMGNTANYVDGGAAPDIKKYLDDGDALLNTVPVGGEGQDVPRAYREYAEATKNALIAAHEQDRSFYVENARARTNAALAYAQEAAQRISNLRSYMEQAAGYTAIANTFAREAEAKLAQINAYLQQASEYANATGGDMTLADRYRVEALERRNEVLSIWRDRKQYIGDFTMGSVRQMPRYSE